MKMEEQGGKGGRGQSWCNVSEEGPNGPIRPEHGQKMSNRYKQGQGRLNSEQGRSNKETATFY